MFFPEVFILLDLRGPCPQVLYMLGLQARNLPNMTKFAICALILLELRGRNAHASEVRILKGLRGLWGRNRVALQVFYWPERRP